VRYYDNFEYDYRLDRNQPCLQISIDPPDWYLKKIEIEKEKLENEAHIISYEIDYTIQDNDSCIIIKDI